MADNIEYQLFPRFFATGLLHVGEAQLALHKPKNIKTKPLWSKPVSTLAFTTVKNCIASRDFWTQLGSRKMFPHERQVPGEARIVKHRKNKPVHAFRVQSCHSGTTSLFTSWVAKTFHHVRGKCTLSIHYMFQDCTQSWTHTLA